MDSNDRAQDETCVACKIPLEVKSVKFSLRRGAITELACRECGRPQEGEKRNLASLSIAATFGRVS
jgi:hypothetical protein